MRNRLTTALTLASFLYLSTAKSLPPLRPLEECRVTGKTYTDATLPSGTVKIYCPAKKDEMLLFGIKPKMLRFYVRSHTQVNESSGKKPSEEDLEKKVSTCTNTCHYEIIDSQWRQAIVTDRCCNSTIEEVYTSWFGTENAESLTAEQMGSYLIFCNEIKAKIDTSPVYEEKKK